ncbi:5'/3'-nucleotidase SurE [Mangrovicoccus sp. HB161399]|uniref:5'/3'-nucleotidase SurE n=1 Tax=Mangrovicoccus sp. HB161399 TaxID=2720392 RepID=UPI0015559191|nr:5'/3'-nucleotidase SurE [Mangrovicoccus sp. HB161399]
MRILITNDDGINAPGLAVLERIAAEVAGPGGEVWTVAPAFEQSGVGHCISYTHPTMIAELGPRRFAAEGAPADCVLAGIYHVMQDHAPDLVLSGVNRGNNSGENVLYSGTLGGALEGALQGIRSIALSQFYGHRNVRLEDSFEAAGRHGARVIRALLDSADWDTENGYDLFYNVNFPACPAAGVKGTRVASQGRRPGVNFSVTAQPSPSGRQFLWARGGDQTVPSAPGTDVAANLDDFISVTPLRADLTAHDRLERLAALLDEG